MPRRVTIKNISPSDDITTMQPQSFPLVPTQNTIDIPKSYAPLLVLLLIIASFFLGSYYTKVQYLEGNGMAKQAEQGTQTQTGATPIPAKKVSVSLGHFPTRGNKNAKVTVVEFADFRCPFCERFFTQTEPQIMKEYVDSGKIQFAFRQFPVLGPASTVAADAAECANNQGKFWDMHDYLYKNQPPESDTSMYTTDTLTQAAGTLGINQDQFRSCLDSKQYESKALADLADGQQAGITGTPTFAILSPSNPIIDVANLHAQRARDPLQSIFTLPDGNMIIIGAQEYSGFQSAIDQVLKKQ